VVTLDEGDAVMDIARVLSEDDVDLSSTIANGSEINGGPDAGVSAEFADLTPDGTPASQADPADTTGENGATLMEPEGEEEEENLE
jgi:hypothetical protein